MSGRSRRLRLASSRIRQASLSITQTSDDTTGTNEAATRDSVSSGEEFEDPRRLHSASERVQRAVQRGLSVLNSRSTLPIELGDRFPFLNRGKKPAGNSRSTKRARTFSWKTVPCCLPNH